MPILEKDSLGNRMKSYEAQTTNERLLSKLPIIARMDGRAFHTFTKGMKRPYDEGMSNLMIATTKFLVKETNAITGYVQSDEISLLFYAEDNSQIFFDGRLFKMVSTLASMTSVFFNKNMDNFLTGKSNENPLFDARVFNVPSEEEASNYFMWREQDATRNSISMAAQSLYTHKELNGRDVRDMQEMMWQKGVNWNNYPDFFKRGTYVQRRKVEKGFSASEILTLPEKHPARINPSLTFTRSEIVTLNVPPIRKLNNRNDVIFGRELAETRQ